MNGLVAFPIVLPLILGSLSLALWRSPSAQRGLGAAGTAALVAVSLWLLSSVVRDGTLVMHVGDWRGPFGIVLVADLLGAIMAVMTAITGLAVAVYSLGAVGRGHGKFGYFPLLHLLLAGVNGVFLTGDIFNLYVWVEVLLVASFALLTLGGERAQMEGAIKYVTLNLISSVLLLVAVGLTYGMFGSLNMADLAVKFDEADDEGLVTVLGMLFLVAFSIKAAAFPFHFWLPASYHTPHVAVSALFAGLLTKVGVYALFRFFTLLFDQDTAYTHGLLLWLAGFTMLVGMLGAMAQPGFRRALAYTHIGQIGYMLMGLGLFTPLAVVGGVFYIIHHIIVMMNLFLLSGIVYRLQGTYDLASLGGLYRSRPALSILFLLPALSVAGVPPLSGFFSKFMVIRAGVEAGNWAIVIVALLTGLLTLAVMARIWSEAFWKEAPRTQGVETPVAGTLGPAYASVTVLSLATVIMGIWAQPVYELARSAGELLLDRESYVTAVLGVRQ